MLSNFSTHTHTPGSTKQATRSTLKHTTLTNSSGPNRVRVYLQITALGRVVRGTDALSEVITTSALSRNAFPTTYKKNTGDKIFQDILIFELHVQVS